MLARSGEQNEGQTAAVMLPDLCSAGECRCSRNVNDFHIESEQTGLWRWAFTIAQAPIFVSGGSLAGPESDK
jgi:hypothetical protein